jgi:hypothetical protein
MSDQSREVGMPGAGQVGSAIERMETGVSEGLGVADVFM